MTDIKALAEVLRSDERLTLTELADRSGVILSLKTRTVASLNETAQFLVARLREGVTDELELARRLAAEFDIDEETARRDITSFLSMLAKCLQL